MPAFKQARRFAISACAIASLELTAERLRMIEILADTERLCFVDQLVREVTGLTGLHPVTVYRFVSELENHGIVHRIRVRSRRVVMLSCMSADYLVCRECGLVKRIPEPVGFREWESVIARRTGFRLAHHWYEISGVCVRCAP